VTVVSPVVTAPCITGHLFADMMGSPICTYDLFQPSEYSYRSPGLIYPID
jgi:hypothetical protein